MKFLAGLFLLAFAPGRAILGVLGLKLPRLETIVLSLVAGTAATTTVNKFARLAGLEAAFAVWIAAGAAYIAVGLFRKPPRPARRGFHPTPAGVFLALVGLAVLALLAVDSFPNARPGPDGSLAIKMHYYDGFLRQAVVRELAHDLPPEMPFAAGHPLGYHFGMDLFISLFNRYLGLDVWDLVHRLLAPVFWLLFAMAIFLFARELTASATAGVLASALAVFGSGGFSWLAELLFGAPIGGNPFYALYLFDGLGVNSFIPGAAVLFSGFYALARYLRERRPGGLVLAALLLALSTEFKIFFAGPVLGAMAVVGLIAFLRFKDKALLAATAATGAFTAPLLLAAYLGSRGGMSYAFSLGFIDWPGRILEALKLGGLASSWKGLLGGAPFEAGMVVVFAAAWAITLFGSLGLSAVALPALVRRFFAGSRESHIHVYVSGLAAACFLDFFLFRTTLGKLSREILNIYVFYVGLILLLITFADIAAFAAAKRKGAARAAILGAAFLLCLPNTVLFLRAKIRVPEKRVFPAAFVETARWLGRETPGRSVILQPLAVRYVSFLSGRRVVLDDTVHSYLEFHLPVAEIGRRRDAVNRFFGDPAVQARVLEEYGVTHVLVPHDQEFPRAGEDGILSLGEVRLRTAFANDGFVVYEVVRSGKPGG